MSEMLEKPRILKATPNSSRRKLRTRWLWKTFVPLGEVTLITGTTDLGKSTVCIDLAGALTQGKLEGEFYEQPVPVLYIALEDTIEKDIAPKLEATDADRDLFFDVTVSNGWINLPTDLDQLSDLIDQTSAKALFIDPIQSVISGDKNKSHEIRPALEAIRTVAEKKGIAIIGVIHQRKGNTGGATEGVMGSAEWANVSRSVIAIKEHKEEPNHFILSVVKGNRARREDRKNLLYKFEQREVDYDDALPDEEPETMAKVTWIGETDISVDDIMESAANGISTSEVGDAIEWMRGAIESNGGEIDAAELAKSAKASGVSAEAFRVARSKLNLDRERNGSVVMLRLR